MPETIDLTRAAGDPAATAPPAKKQCVSPKPSHVWVLTKGDHPEDRYDKLVKVEVLGVYSTRAKAEDAKAEYLEEGGWQEGYGYHQGTDAESNIEIHEQTLE